MVSIVQLVFSTKMHKLGYKASCILGKGTFGTVYKCTNAKGEDCCIKRIPIMKSTPEKMEQHIEMIKREIYLLIELKHPRVISIQSNFYVYGDNHIHIVMEYARNGSLLNLLHKRHGRLLNGAEILNYFTDILMGLEFLHMKGVIHKDLKTENILVCKKGRLKIADFGIAKVSNVNADDAALLATMKLDKNELAGTPIYMAPETVFEQKITFASDIWALGCIFYELCVLKHPFSFAKSMADLQHCIKNLIYKPIVNRNLSNLDTFSALLKDMLTADHHERATMKSIISNKLVVGPYYQKYFDFGFDVYFGLIDDSMFRK